MKRHTHTHTQRENERTFGVAFERFQDCIINAREFNFRRLRIYSAIEN